MIEALAWSALGGVCGSLLTTAALELGERLRERARRRRAVHPRALFHLERKRHLAALEAILAGLDSIPQELALELRNRRTP